MEGKHMNKDRNVEKVRPENLVEQIANKTYISPEAVSAILGAVEDVVIDKISSVSENKDISVKLFDGFFIEGKYQEAKETENNLTGESIEIPEKINIRGRFTRAFKEKISKDA